MALGLAPWRVTCILALVVCVGGAVPAEAAFPGANGKIAFETDGDIHTINPDGTGEANLTNSAARDYLARWRPDGQKIAFESDGVAMLMNPDGTGATPLAPSNPDAYVDSWSPDGQKIAYTVPVDPSGYLVQSQIAVANADGTNQTLVTDGATADSGASWSPDGQKIVFARATVLWDSECECYATMPPSIVAMNPDGSGQTTLLDPSFWRGPLAWSPDSQMIAFAVPLLTQSNGTKYDLFTINADGGNLRNLTNTPALNEEQPAWSPDGKKIASMTQSNVLAARVRIMNADASSPGFLAFGQFPDWQPLATASYPHPQSAASLQASLVPTFRPCGTGASPTNGQHSPPLGTQSCLPPVPGSNVARVGATSQGSTTFTVVPGDTDPTNGDQADVTLSASLSDVKTTGGADYAPNPSGPDLTEITRLRLTDKANNYGGASATATEYDFRVPIDCVATSDPSTGSTCSTSTSADSLLPGFITEQRQTVVQAFRVRVDDAGSNGTTGDSDDRIFATQGIYIP